MSFKNLKGFGRYKEVIDNRIFKRNSQCAHQFTGCLKNENPHRYYNNKYDSEDYGHVNIKKSEQILNSILSSSFCSDFTNLFRSHYTLPLAALLKLRKRAKPIQVE